MYERTYDIIDWKSCDSGSVDAASSAHHVNKNDIPAVSSEGLPQKTSGGSNSEIIVFPTLFYEDNESETSIVTLPSFESDCWRSETHEGVPDDIEQLSVYQKVANWVFTQKGFFRKEEEHVIEDDDMEVIDPVDLFHESVLDDYMLVTEDDIERRAILRDLNDNRYDIVSVQELMQTHEYKFIREPKGEVELELEHIVEFGEPKIDEKSKKGKTRKKSRKRVSTCDSLDVEGLEEKILFLGVPRLLENYVILNREGYKVDLDDIPDLWLSPFEENLNENNGADENNHSELEFLSSWFSDVYQTDIITADRRPTLMTDMLEKLTVITVWSDDDEVWLDAPEIPHWLDEEPEELELFNQPSRPLYYYRDRIKGCYRIIGVEDEQVVLFSGNDDDTIFYAEENSFSPIVAPMNTISELDNPAKDERMPELRRPSIQRDRGPPGIVSKYRRIYNRLRYGKVEKDDTNDTKHDSGIDEDIDDNACDDLSLSPFSLSSNDRGSFSDVVLSVKRPSFSIDSKKESFVEILFVVMGAVIVLITLVLYDGESPLFQMYRSRITEEACDDIYMLMKSAFR